MRRALSHALGRFSRLQVRLSLLLLINPQLLDVRRPGSDAIAGRRAATRATRPRMIRPIKPVDDPTLIGVDEEHVRPEESDLDPACN